ncbi:MAG TPA: adenosine deaminase, partial [Polyangia bacterium]|nr:adenosine deaminase [Polyangia bacterium]
SIEGDATQLSAFLTSMPKGGDLHHHLSGAVYAETYLDWAAAASDCIETTAGSYYLSIDNSCTYAGDVPIPATTDPLYTQVVEAMSMLNFVATPTESGHDHFFSTFSLYGAMSGTAHHAAGLADVLTRGASENEVYIEAMLTSDSTAEDLGTSTWSTTNGTAAMTAADFDAFRTALLASSTWASAVSAITTDIANTESGAQSTLGCSGASPPPACGIATRYQVYISRSGAAPAVFAQMVAAYEAAKVEPRLVALNLVGPEDGTTALKNYDLQMAMLQYLSGVYAGQSPLRLALHAGELAAQYMPSGYTIPAVDHVQKAVEIAGAERIGHGVDIAQESASATVLSELAAKKILVEVCLSSNAQILLVTGTAHPLAQYRAAGVPVALATDDQGVSRSSMAGEYVRAVTDQKLGYLDLKELSRNSLEYSFLPGASLFGDFASLAIVPACADATDAASTTAPTAACAAYLSANPRAQVQWELERRYRVFESTY